MNLPTKITVSRIVATVLMFVVLFVLSFFDASNFSLVIDMGNCKIDGVFLILLVFFIIASLTDMLDGYLARSRNEVTTLGKFLDPIADKLLVNSLVIFLIAPQMFAKYNTVQTVSIPVWCAILMIARDIVVDAIRFIAASKKVVIAANIFGKLKTVFQMIAIGFVLANGFPFSFIDYNFLPGLRITDFLVYIATAMSLISGVIYVIQNKHVLKE